MNTKQIYIRPESESEESLLLQSIIMESNTETFEGGQEDDITW